MITLSNKKVKRQSDLKSYLWITIAILTILIPVLIWGDVS